MGAIIVRLTRTGVANTCVGARTLAVGATIFRGDTLFAASDIAIFANDTVGVVGIARSEIVTAWLVTVLIGTINSAIVILVV